MEKIDANEISPLWQIYSEIQFNLFGFVYTERIILVINCIGTCIEYNHAVVFLQVEAHDRPVDLYLAFYFHL